MKRPIYMDHHATTPVDPRVLEEMLPYFSERFGNAASRNHPYGWEAESAVEQARERIARLIHASSKEIVLTSGATESNNLAIKGAVEFYRERGNHVVTAATEHKSVLDTLRLLQKNGAIELTVLRVDRYGRVDPEDVRTAITPRTVLVSIMFGNNEVGTIHPVAEIGRITNENGVLFHTDAAQAAGKVPIDVVAMGIDLLSLTAHKTYGPKGVGALYVRSRSPRVRLSAQMDGGGQERGFRSGTLNVPGVVGLGKACEVAGGAMEEEAARLRALRERLHQGIVRELDGVTLNGHPTERLPGNLSLSFSFVEGESLLLALNDDVALSSGSACTSATLEPSHVLKALGLSPELAHCSIRFGLGRTNVEEDVDRVVERVVAEVRRLRRMSPLYGVSGRDDLHSERR
ncbi:MAG: IscS subfamily cysteine desulfurase [Candidatus Binatia bacterium]